MQLEFVMLDPYVRTTLKHNGKVSGRKQPYCSVMVRNAVPAMCVTVSSSASCRLTHEDVHDRDL